MASVSRRVGLGDGVAMAWTNIVGTRGVTVSWRLIYPFTCSEYCSIVYLGS